MMTAANIWAMAACVTVAVKTINVFARKIIKKELVVKSIMLAVFFSCLFSSYISPIKYLQTITVTFPNELPMVLVDHKPIKCHCGKKPVQIDVLNGIVHASCADHMVKLEI